MIPTLQNHGSLLRKVFKVLHRAPSYRPTIETPRIPRTSNQPQYKPPHLCFESNVDLLHILVFELPDELILSILSHIAPNPQVIGHCAWFRDSYGARENHRYQRTQFLRRLSMTCRAMRLRFVPWVWERLEISMLHYWRSREINIIANALEADVLLVTSIRYFCALFCP